MPSTYFHVDRLNRLVVGQQIEPAYSQIDLTNFKTNRAEMLAGLFPNGLSYHGQRYLIDERIKPAEDLDGQVEVFAEFMRRSRFQRRPSRYQSLFACRSIEDAMKFRDEYGGNVQVNESSHASIWEVETRRPVFEADLRLLTHGVCWSECFIFLDWYWRGMQSDNPLIEALLPLPVRVLRRVA